IKAFEFHHPGFHPNMTDKDMAEVLDGCAGKVTSFRCSKISFRDLSTQALVRGHALILTLLELGDSGFITSTATIRILSSCPQLIYFSSSGSLDARGILGVKRTKSESKEYEEWCDGRLHSKNDRVVQPPSTLQQSQLRSLTVNMGNAYTLDDWSRDSLDLRLAD
ncbi:hypothetical protein BGZ65_011052, partial [Modicella reniformis]